MKFLICKKLGIRCQKIVDHCTHHKWPHSLSRLRANENRNSEYMAHSARVPKVLTNTTSLRFFATQTCIMHRCVWCYSQSTPCDCLPNGSLSWLFHIWGFLIIWVRGLIDQYFWGWIMATNQSWFLWVVKPTTCLQSILGLIWLMRQTWTQVDTQSGLWLFGTG